MKNHEQEIPPTLPDDLQKVVDELGLIPRVRDEWGRAQWYVVTAEPLPGKLRAALACHGLMTYTEDPRAVVLIENGNETVGGQTMH